MANRVRLSSSSIIISSSNNNKKKKRDCRVTLFSQYHLYLLMLLFVIILEDVSDAVHSPSYNDLNGVDLSAVNRRQEYHFRKIQAFKASLLQKDSASPIPSSPPPLVSPSPTPSSVQVSSNPRVFHVTSYGADPTGKSDSTDALLKAFADATASNSNADNNIDLISGIVNFGGAQINLEGGRYLISRSLKFPLSGAGNILINGGTLEASDDFPKDRYLIELSPPSSSTSQNQTEDNKASSSSSSSSYNYEYITVRDIMLDCKYRGGGISVINSIRTSIDNLYIAHFTTNAILVNSGHETLIRNSYIGQHITAGSDPDEKNFSGTGITLIGNDNIVSDVIIFSAATGILIQGQANLISGVHCYNKATGFGGTGIYLKVPGLTQTRIVNSYMDYTGIVVEDPVQLVMSNNFFLGDAYITLKSIKGIARGLHIVDNIFSGSDNGVDIVHLDESAAPFRDLDQLMIDRNIVGGMKNRATAAKVTVEGNGTSWVADFNDVLVFPNLIKHVQFTYHTTGESFPNFALRNLTDNKVVIQSDVPAPSSVYVTVDQGYSSTR